MYQRTLKPFFADVLLMLACRTQPYSNVALARTSTWTHMTVPWPCSTCAAVASTAKISLGQPRAQKHLGAGGMP